MYGVNIANDNGEFVHVIQVGDEFVFIQNTELDLEVHEVRLILADPTIKLKYLEADQNPEDEWEIIEEEIEASDLLDKQGIEAIEALLEHCFSPSKKLLEIFIESYEKKYMRGDKEYNEITQEWYTPEVYTYAVQFFEEWDTTGDKPLWILQKMIEDWAKKHGGKKRVFQKYPKLAEDYEYL